MNAPFARNIFSGQIGIAESHQIVPSGEPEIPHNLITSLNSHAILPRSKTRAVGCAGGNAKVHFLCDVPRGAATRELGQGRARQNAVIGNGPILAA